MSMVECKCCGVWADPDDAEGAYDKAAPFGWKCDECLMDDCEKADDHGYIVPDQDALDDRAEVAYERKQAADLECPPMTMQEQLEQSRKQKHGFR